MKYRQLGRTGIQVSEVGFGAWGIGGDHEGAVAYGPVDPGESKQALRRAYELGITFFDTADLYGFGYSEQLLGEALHDVRSRIVIATKGGMLDAAGRQDFSPDYLRRALEGSLRRLRTDFVDLYQLHSPPLDILADNPELWNFLHRVRTEGKARRCGISLRSPEDGLTAIQDYCFEAVQVNFNLVDQRAMENGLFARCGDQGVGVIVRTPLCFGFLSGQDYDPGKLDVRDHRRRWSPTQIARWMNAQRLFEAALNDGTSHTPAQAALRFCLSSEVVSTVIPGMLTVQHVEENVAASNYGPLSTAAVERAAQVFRSNEFFEGKRSDIH